MPTGITTFTRQEALELKKSYKDAGYLDAKIIQVGTREWKVIMGERIGTLPNVEESPSPTVAREARELRAREIVAGEERARGLIAMELVAAAREVPPREPKPREGRIGAREELAKEQLAALRAARAQEPAIQSIRIPKTPVRIPVKVPSEAARAIHMREQRRVKDATHVMDDLRDKYGLTGRESPDAIRDKIMEKGYTKDYSDWLAADQAIREEGRLGYPARAGIVALARTGQAIEGGTKFALKDVQEGLRRTGGRAGGVVAGMKRAIPRAMAGTQTVFGRGSGQPPAISEFGRARIAQEPGIPKIAGQIDLSKLRGKRYEE